MSKVVPVLPEELSVASGGESAPGSSSLPRSQCPYCGVGCGLELKPPQAGGETWTARGDRHHPSSLGQVCVKGATVGDTLHHNRLTTPQYRSSIDQPFAPTSWEQAFSLIVGSIRSALDTRGANAIAIYGSGQFLIEDYYIANKLLKGALGSNNFDANSRLCMSSAVVGYSRSLGSGGPPCCYDDLDAAELVVLVGTNTAECHPVLFQRLFKRKRKQPQSLRIVVIDPRCTATSDAADLHLQIAPGTDLALLHGIGQQLIANGAINLPYVERCTNGYPALAELWAAWTPEQVSQVCGLEQADIERLAALWAESPAVLTLWSMRGEPEPRRQRHGERHRESAPGDGSNRQARGRSLFAHRPAQCHGRPGGRRPGQTAAGLSPGGRCRTSGGGGAPLAIPCRVDLPPGGIEHLAANRSDGTGRTGPLVGGGHQSAGEPAVVGSG